MLGIALGVVLVGSQVLHIATFEKSFLDDDDRKKVAAYLDAHDENDFVFTNLLSDGPIQYYFQRHLQPIDAHWPPGSYRTLLRRIGPDRMHLVIFEDPNSCFVDKSLFPLLAVDGRWTTIGAPPLNRMAALEAISAFDRDVHKTFALEATLALRAGRISVYSIGSAEILALLRGSPQLAHVTEHIDFAEHTSNDFKIYGMRGPEPGKPYSWSIHRRRARTVLTRTGVVWSDGAPVLEVGLLLNLPAGADYRITLHALTNVPDQTLGAMIGDRVLMPPAPLAPPWTSQAFTFTVPKDALGSDPVVTLRFPYTARGLAKEAVAVDGEVPDVGVAFESLDAVPLP